MKADMYKAERNRIFRLVENARANDPRVIKKEKEDFEAKEKIRLEKELKKKQKKEEEERIIREKRAMEKENRKMKADMYKAERNRIFRLVENARANDPRVIKKEKEDFEA